MKKYLPPQIVAPFICATALILALGCSKETEQPAPTPASQSAPAPPASSTQQASSSSTRQTPAEANSFYLVMEKLDQGGQVYAYLSTEQWLTGVSGKLDGLKSALIENIPASTEERAQIDKGVAAAIRFIRNSGMEDISGIGFSGFAVEKDLHRSKFIIHHYPGKGNGFGWSVFGDEPGELEGLRLLPATTAVASSSKFDLPGLWAAIEAEVKAAGFPQADEQLNQAKGMFAMMTGLDFEKFLGSLGGEYGLAITLDKAQPVQIPGEQVTTIPRPDILIFSTVNDTMVFDRLISMAKAQEMPILEDESNGVKTASMPVPIPIGAEYKLTVASTKGLLLIGTSPTIVQDALSVRAGDKPGLTSTPEFKELAQGIPMEANSFSYVSKAFGVEYMNFQMKTMELNSASSDIPMPLVRKMLESFSKPAASFGTFRNTEEGWMWSGNSTTPTATQFAAAAVVAPAGLLAAIAIPNFVKARSTAQRNTCIAHLKQIDGAKQQWAIDNKKNGADIPTKADLYGLTMYLKREPTCPNGGVYTINPVNADPTCSHGKGHTLNPHSQSSPPPSSFGPPRAFRTAPRSNRDLCIVNLRQMDGAKQQWAIDNKKDGADLPKDTDLFGPTLYITNKPTCPDGGAYTLGSIRENPVCSHGDSKGHKLH